MIAAYDGSHFAPPAPLARVTLRHPASGAIVSNVSMLLDTGADVTLVPRVSADRLGVEVDPEEGYELMGFDGPTSFARVAHAWRGCTCSFCSEHLVDVLC